MTESHFYTEQELRDLKLRKTTKPLKKTIRLTARGIGRLGKAVLAGLERLGEMQPRPKKRRIRIVPSEKPSLEVRIEREKARRQRRNRYR